MRSGLFFPRQLWHIATTDTTGAIQVNPAGNGVLIDRPLFAQTYLASGAFRTSRLASFIRQLNIYGFKQDSTEQFHMGNGRLATQYVHKSFNFFRPRLDEIKRETNSTGRTRVKKVKTETIHEGKSHPEVTFCQPPAIQQSVDYNFNAQSYQPYPYHQEFWPLSLTGPQEAIPAEMLMEQIDGTSKNQTDMEWLRAYDIQNYEELGPADMLLTIYGSQNEESVSLL